MLLCSVGVCWAAAETIRALAGPTGTAGLINIINTISHITNIDTN